MSAEVWSFLAVAVPVCMVATAAGLLALALYVDAARADRSRAFPRRWQ